MDGRSRPYFKEPLMTRTIGIAFTTVLLSGVIAQAQPPASPATRIGLAAGLQRLYSALKENMTAEAEKMSEADYSFKPGPTADVRPFGQVIAHVAQAQFAQCSSLTGVPNPMRGKNLEQELKTKADIVKALNDSFALCDKAFADTTEENAKEFIRLGPTEVMRAAALYNVLVHGSEMYGTGAVYLRSKGIIPPTTEKAQQGRGRGQH